MQTNPNEQRYKLKFLVWHEFFYVSLFHVKNSTNKAAAIIIYIRNFLW